MYDKFSSVISVEPNSAQTNIPIRVSLLVLTGQFNNFQPSHHRFSSSICFKEENICKK